MSTRSGQPRKRGGRVVDKATPERVMEPARNLPLTHCVLRDAVGNATPGQLGFLANLFERENASRAESKRRRLLKQAGFPQNKTLDGYDRSMASFPSDRGREQLESLDSSTGPRTSCSTATSAAARPTWPSRSACSPASA